MPRCTIGGKVDVLLRDVLNPFRAGHWCQVDTPYDSAGGVPYVLNPFRAGHWCQVYAKDGAGLSTLVLNPFRAGHWCQDHSSCQRDTGHTGFKPLQSGALVPRSLNALIYSSPIRGFKPLQSGALVPRRQYGVYDRQYSF